MELRGVDTPTLVARRARLATRLAIASMRAPVSIFSGAPRPRNYPAATHPYRASSHFLYLTGVAIPNAVLHLAGGEITLFVPKAPTDDALWHGRTPSLDDLAEAIGCPVRPVDELPREPGATISSIDAATRILQTKLLGRRVSADSQYPSTSEDGALMDAMIAVRLRHDEAAVSELRAAAEATTAAHAAGMAHTEVGRTEWDVQAAMEFEFARRGMCPAYQPIVTTRGEVLHNHARGLPLEDGDLLLVDVGAESRGGFAGDVTRTWPVNGRFSGTQRAMYEVVLASQEAAIAMLAPGVEYKDVHLAATRALIDGLVQLEILKGDVDQLLADGVGALFFPHGVGHLLGLDVHDMEDLGDRAGYAPGRERDVRFGLKYLRLDRPLEAGMAVTIEPGFYQVPAILQDGHRSAVARDRLNRAELAKFADVRGIRIEDDVLIEDRGATVLTSAIPKTVAEVEAAVGG